MSSSLSWLVIRNNNSFLVKRRNIDKPFSKEPANLTNLNSFRYNGLVHAKTIALSDTADNKGFTVTYKKRGGGGRRKPATAAVKRTFKGGPRRSLYKLRRFIRFSKYRTDLTKAALRRASALLRAQKPVKPKKTKPAAVAAE